MKFKLSRQNFEIISEVFTGKETMVGEIELEPVIETAARAIYEEDLKAKAYHKGYHTGFKEGYWAAKNKYCQCGCGGNNCFTRFCDDKCHLFNI